MKTRLLVDAIMSATPVIGQALVLELDMTESQMYQALNSFLEHITDATWAKWQAQINAECYPDEVVGAPA